MTDKEYAVVEKVLKEVHEACRIVPTSEEFDKELIATMYKIRIEYEAMKERMNHFEAWFANAFDRIGTIEKQVAGLQQQMKIWFDGRGGMS